MKPIKPQKHVGEQSNNHDQVMTQIYKVLRRNVSYGRQVTGGYSTDNIDGNFAAVPAHGSCEH